MLNIYIAMKAMVLTPCEKGLNMNAQIMFLVFAFNALLLATLM